MKSIAMLTASLALVAGSAAAAPAQMTEAEMQTVVAGKPLTDGVPYDVYLVNSVKLVVANDAPRGERILVGRCVADSKTQCTFSDVTEGWLYVVGETLEKSKGQWVYRGNF